MATLIVETGQRSVTSNSYVTLEYAKQYFADRGVAEWPQDGVDDLQTTALFNARIAMDSLFYGRYMSQRATETQALQWPRTSFHSKDRRYIDGSTIPTEIMNAQCELALKAFNGEDLYPEENTDNNVASESIKVGDISQSVSYRKMATDVATYADWRQVELIISPILRSKTKKIRFGL